jgi:hypothetical protein
MLHCTFVIIFWPARAKPRHLEQFIGHAYFCPRDAAGCGERVRELGLAMDRRVPWIDMCDRGHFPDIVLPVRSSSILKFTCINAALSKRAGDPEGSER